MTRPPLTLALSTVLAADVESERREGLLRVLRPDFGRPSPRPDSTVVPLPRVIPLPTRPQDDDEPDPAA